MQSNILKDLYALGYDREDLNNTKVDFNNPNNKNLSCKSINHSIVKNAFIRNINFDFAAATGSLYKKCIFSNCSMHQTDFEFCHFDDCTIKSHKKVISSFNNTNFLDTVIEDTVFESCTFTGAFFDNCTFKNVKIINSTLEGAYFNNCKFYNMDLREINMEYISIVSPEMDNVILPFAQIPFMFGCLQYINESNETIRISSSDNKTISAKHYLKVGIPKLIEYWENSREENSEFNFPLANIYIAEGNLICAAKCIYDGLRFSLLEEDYRMIKFYCKLLSECDILKPKVKELFYALINNIGSKKETHDARTRSFIRNIGEIRASLFESKKETTLYIKFVTNLSFNNPQKIGEYLEKLFCISKMKYKSQSNEVVFEISENSPFTIGITITGPEDNIISLLPSFLQLGNIKLSDIYSNPYEEELIVVEKNVLQQSEELISACNRDSVDVTLVEYIIENCPICDEKGFPTFYYNIDIPNDSQTFIKLLQ